MTENELRARVCALAESWVDKKQADGSHREIIDIYNQIRPLPRGYKMTYTDFWCAATVSALAQALGLTDYIFPECSCDRMIQLYKQHGRWMEDDAYVPKPGDVIFYDWDDSGEGDNTGSSDHIGTVIGVSGSVINIIEGNCGKAVQHTARQVNGRYIRGYGLPDYAAAAAELTEDEPVEAPEVVIIPDDGEDTNVPTAPEETVTMPALRPGRALNFWVCDQTEDEELFTVDAMTIPVVRRPPGVAEAPSAEQASALDQAIAAANRAAEAAASATSPFTILEGSVTLTQTYGQPDQWTDIVLPDFDAIEDLPHTILVLTVNKTGTAAPVTILMTAPQTKNWWWGMTASPNWVLTLTASTRRFTLDGFVFSSEFSALAGTLDECIGRLDSLEERVSALEAPEVHK